MYVEEALISPYSYASSWVSTLEGYGWESMDGGTKGRDSGTAALYGGYGESRSCTSSIRWYHYLCQFLGILSMRSQSHGSKVPTLVVHFGPLAGNFGSNFSFEPGLSFFRITIRGTSTGGKNTSNEHNDHNRIIHLSASEGSLEARFNYMLALESGLDARGQRQAVRCIWSRIFHRATFRLLNR